MSTNKTDSVTLFNNIQTQLKDSVSVSATLFSDKGLCLTINNQHAQVVISMFGGQVLSYINKADNKERLWLSPKAIFDTATPIRGGIPICWPWFSSHPSNSSYPSHGYARTQMFSLFDVAETYDKNLIVGTKVTLAPSSAKQYGFMTIGMKLVINVTNSLTIDILSINEGCEPIALSQALHTYCLVDDISQVQLLGLQSPYDDKVSRGNHVCAPNIYKFSEEVDRIHHFAHEQYTQREQINIINSHTNLAEEALSEQAKSPSIRKIQQSGHDSTIVWNPWKDKSQNMKDMPSDGYKTMLCIEAGNTVNAAQPLILGAIQIHKLSQTIF
jgi:glucose-6-phosphate 1-epimerase